MLNWAKGFVAALGVFAAATFYAWVLTRLPDGVAMPVAVFVAFVASTWFAKLMFDARS